MKRFECPACGKQMSYLPNQGGRAARCDDCGGTLSISMADAERDDPGSDARPLAEPIRLPRHRYRPGPAGTSVSKAGGRAAPAVPAKKAIPVWVYAAAALGAIAAAAAVGAVIATAGRGGP